MWRLNLNGFMFPVGYPCRVHPSTTSKKPAICAAMESKPHNPPNLWKGSSVKYPMSPNLLASYEHVLNLVSQWARFLYNFGIPVGLSS